MLEYFFHFEEFYLSISSLILMLIFQNLLLCENNECQVRKGFLGKLLIWANRCRVNNPHESYVNDPLRSSFCQHNIDHSFYYYHNQFIGKKYSNIKIQIPKRIHGMCAYIYLGKKLKVIHNWMSDNSLMSYHYLHFIYA